MTVALRLRTDRLVLRPVDAGDLDDVHALHCDDAVMRYLSRARARREDVRDAVLPAMLAWERRHPAWGYSAAVEAATGAFLGWVLFRPATDRPPAPGELEIGWRFAAPRGAAAAPPRPPPRCCTTRSPSWTCGRCSRRRWRSTPRPGG